MSERRELRCSIFTVDADDHVDFSIPSNKDYRFVGRALYLNGLPILAGGDSDPVVVTANSTGTVQEVTGEFSLVGQGQAIVNLTTATATPTASDGSMTLASFVPETYRPTSAKTVPITVVHNDYSESGLATVDPNGDLTFSPVGSSFGIQTEGARTNGLPANSPFTILFGLN